MATTLLGTATTTSLVSLVWNPMSAQADIAAIAANIKQQANPAHYIGPGFFSNAGRLEYPGRKGFILLKPGDIVAYDNFGWPVVVSNESYAGGSSWLNA